MRDPFTQVTNQITADDYWERLAASGWLVRAQLPQPTDELRAQIVAEFARDRRYVWALLATIVFDAECIYETGPDKLSYHAQIQQLADESRGVFQPTQLADIHEGETITISFEHAGRRYSYDARADSDYFDTGVIGWINVALADAGIAERFMQLPAFDQCVYLTVVPAEVYQAAVGAGVIPATGLIVD
jgi:hypothetical protein